MSAEPQFEPTDAEVVIAVAPRLHSAAPAGEEEIVDGVPVLERDESLMALSSAREMLSVMSPSAVQAAAAVTGFVAGAATLAIMHRRGARRLARAAARSRRGADALPIVGTRTFLIDVHLLKPSE